MSSLKEQILPLLEQMYPERYDFNGNSLIIHFPEINITNSRNKKRVLKDMFVRLSLSTNRLTGWMDGMRTTYFMDEAYSGYCHSHLPGRSLIGDGFFRGDNAIAFNNFCVGSGPFASMLADLLNDRFNIDLFERFLMFLPTYLSWESLEGGPYRRMEQIQHRASNGRDSNRYYAPGSHHIILLQEILANLKDLPLKVTEIGSKKRFEIETTNEDLYRTVASISSIKKYTNGQPNVYYNSIPGSSGGSEHERLMANIRGSKHFKFRGTEIPVTIIEPNKVVTKPEEGYYLETPKPLVHSVLHSLNNEITNYYIQHELK